MNVFDKKGIYVICETWENDADNYATKTIGPMSLKSARLVKEFAEKFESRHSRKDTERFGNSDNYEKIGELEQELINNVCEDDKELLSEVHYDLIGMWCEGEYSRVVERVNIVQVSEPVKVIE